MKSGATSAAELRERKKDQERVDRAKNEARMATLRGQLAHELQNESRLNATRPTRRDDPHEVVDWEEERSATRARIRKIRQQMKELPFNVRRRQ